MFVLAAILAGLAAASAAAAALVAGRPGPVLIPVRVRRGARRSR